MTIKTKFNLNDKVWIISKNKVVETTIESISLNIKNRNPDKIVYELAHYENDDYHANRIEENLYKSKQALLKSL